MYRVTCKTSPVEKSLCFNFDEVDGCIEKRGRDQHLPLFQPNEKYERLFDRIKYLISQKNNISDVYY